MNQVSGGAPGSLGSRAYSGRWRTGKRVFRFFRLLGFVGVQASGFRESGGRWRTGKQGWG